MEESVQNEFILSPGVKNNSAEVIAEVKHVSKHYKGCLALNDVSLQIHRGDLIGLVGKNGAGKTTLIRVLTGLAKPSSGSFSLFGSSERKDLSHNLGKVAAMYTTKIDGKDFAIKPMNCPGAILVYKNDIHSYKDLPLRYAELGHVHRHEASGALNGLFRVRAFTQDDAHIMTKFVTLLADVSIIDKAPFWEEKWYQCILAPKKK